MSAVRTMTTGEAVVQGLIANGIDTIFGVPGVQNDYLFDALYEHREQIRTLHTRHEQGAGYMALGAALATGRPAAYTVVPGPGLLNSAAALCTAYACNAPVLAVTGQIPAALIGRGLGMLHELPDQLAILRGLTKWAERIRAPHEAPGLVEEAFRHLQSGRPRPVALECAIDVWPRRAPVVVPKAAIETAPVPVDVDAVNEAAKLLGAARRPLIIVGGGAIEAREHVARLAEMLQAPVGAHRSGLGVLDSRHPYAVSVLTASRFWADADVVLAVGTRLQLQQMNWGVDADLKIVRVDIDPDEIARLRRPAVGIVGDASPVLHALVDALPAHNRKRESRKDEIAQVREGTLAELRAGFAPQAAWLDAMRAALPEHGIFVDEVTQIGHAARLLWPAYAPRTYLSTGYQGTLGWGVPTALGVKAAMPDAPVLSISGDGGFMFGVQELATAVQHRLGVVFVVFNDNAYGNVRRIQAQELRGRVIASDLVNPDFVKLAESFGIAAQRVTSPEALAKAAGAALARNEPALIEVPVGEMPNPFAILRFTKPVRGG